MKKNIQVSSVQTADYTYILPEDRIAYQSLEKRDESRLMVVNNQEFLHTYYKELPAVLPSDAHLVFNNTKVISARLHFANKNNKAIEIFLLEPVDGNYASLHNKEQSVWNCMVGGAKKWNAEETLLKPILSEDPSSILEATLLEKKDDCYVVSFKWQNNMTFYEVVEKAGKTPLPPYIKREANSNDALRYQTIFAKEEGSVAAPTAGLHFTEELLGRLNSNGISSSQLTLHVGAGTFKPVTATSISDHIMHKEFFEVPLETLQALSTNDLRIIPVGTTSLRTLESLYWMGLKIYHHKNNLSPLNLLDQWEHIDLDSLPQPNYKIVFNHLIEVLQKEKLNSFHGHTGICITPGYSFKVAKGLITNFHQPQSTLLLIIGAILGGRWKNMYETALENEYRFLSYGDGSLLFIEDSA
jgi:S-adenosylmethionine:tRNA ribosyltransferase-isomerase